MIYRSVSETDTLEFGRAFGARLGAGDVVALHGDRAFGGEALEAPFLGSPAGFPIGPYLLASVAGAPVFQTFAMREGIGRYRFFCFPAQRVPRLRRTDTAALRTLVETYVQRLETVVRQYPFQWYNFFPFWQRGKETRT